MKWLQSRTVWIMIINFLIGVCFLVDEVFGTNLMTTDIAGGALAVLSALGIYTRVNTKVK